MSVDANDIRDAALDRRILDAIRESEFEDTTVQEIADEVEENYQYVRKRVRFLREDGRVEVTRTAGPAKLYRVSNERGS